MNKPSVKLPTLSVDLVRAARQSRGPLSRLSPSVLRKLEERYRMYLRLKSKNFDSVFAPTEVIDEMWHLHMLHPRAYAKDCLAIFGTILDHNPGFGAAEGELPTLLADFEHTGELWEAEYGTPYVNPEMLVGERRTAVATTHGVVMCEDKKGPEPEPKPRPQPKPTREAIALAAAAH